MAQCQALSSVLRHFARTMARTYDTSDALYGLSESVVDVMGADAAGVTLLDGDRLRFLTATNAAGAEAEAIQERLQRGPCATSVQLNQPVAIDDLLAHGDRWPEFTAAVEEAGFRAILALPMILDGQRVGSLDVYSCEPRRWTESSISDGLALADIGAAYVLNASEMQKRQRTTEQLQTALHSRVVIEQAKGVLAERVGISTEDAFHQIRLHARSRHLRVTDVCQIVIDTDFVPD